MRIQETLSPGATKDTYKDFFIACDASGYELVRLKISGTFTVVPGGTYVPRASASLWVVIDKQSAFYCSDACQDKSFLGQQLCYRIEPNRFEPMGYSAGNGVGDAGCSADRVCGVQLKMMYGTLTVDATFEAWGANFRE